MRRSLFALAAATLVLVSCATAAPPTPTAKPAAPAPTAAPASPTKVTPPTAAPTAAAAPTKAAAVVAPTAASKPADTPPALPKVADFPTKPVKMIIPWDAGGGVDVAGRILAAQMEKEIGQSVQVVNMPGASTQVGMQALVDARPDGYTILYTAIPSSVSVYLDPERKATFSSKDFVIGPQVVIDPMCVGVQKDSKYKTLNDLVADLKANPEKIKAGDTGLLAVNHLAILQLEQITGSKFATVHFTGGAPLVTALLGGHVDVEFNSTSGTRSAIQSGQVRLLAVSSDKRSKYYPDVPTYKELGFNVSAAAIHGMIWPKGVPADISMYWEAAILRQTYAADMRQKMDASGVDMIPASSEEFAKTWMEQEKLYLQLSKLATP